MTPTVLVTGGSGFVGTHVVRALVEAGAAVVDFSATPPSPTVRRFLGRLDAAVLRIQGDVQDGPALAKVFARHAIGTVVHAGAINGEPNVRAAPERGIRINVAGTATVVARAAAAGVRRVVYIASSSAYGITHGDRTPIPEDTPPSPSGLYPATKIAAELTGAEIARLAGVPFVALRVAAPYGPGEDIVPTPLHVRYWCEAALDGRPVAMESGGDQVRDFTYAPDTGRAVAIVALARRLRHDLYNVSTGRPTTLGDVVAAVRGAEPGARLSVGPGLLPGHATPGTWSVRGPLDTTRLRRELGFRPRVGLVAGVARYLAWLRRERALAAPLSG